MAYTEKFQNLADAARSRVEEVLPEDVDALLAEGAIALDIRDKEEHNADHIEGSLNISRGKLEMLVEGRFQILIPQSYATATPLIAERCQQIH